MTSRKKTNFRNKHPIEPKNQRKGSELPIKMLKGTGLQMLMTSRSAFVERISPPQNGSNAKTKISVGARTGIICNVPDLTPRI